MYMIRMFDNFYLLGKQVILGIIKLNYNMEGCSTFDKRGLIRVHAMCFPFLIVIRKLVHGSCPTAAFTEFSMTNFEI